MVDKIESNEIPKPAKPKSREEKWIEDEFSFLPKKEQRLLVDFLEKERDEGKFENFKPFEFAPRFNRLYMSFEWRRNIGGFSLAHKINKELNN